MEVLVINSKELLINEEIRDKEVRVIDADGAQLGIMAFQTALKLAADKNLDVVRIVPQAVPPVCRIMDYGKFCFEQQKREKEVRKNQHTVNVKEVQLSYKLAEHDLQTKLGHALKFLQNGDKVKVVMKLWGREMKHALLGEAAVREFGQSAAEHGTVEKIPKLEGRNIIMILAPKVTK